MSLKTYLFTPQCIAVVCVLVPTLFAVARQTFLRPYFASSHNDYYGEMPYGNWYRIIFDKGSKMDVREKFLRLYIYHGYTTLYDLNRVCSNSLLSDFNDQKDAQKTIAHARNQLTKNQQFLRFT